MVSMACMRRLAARLSFAVLLFAAASLPAGCGRLLGPKPETALPSYPDGPAGLEAMFKDILVAAKADERERVHQYFGSLKMTPAELARLFGRRAAELQRPYDDMMGTLIHRGAVELVAVVFDKKYDTVEVLPVTLPAPDARATATPAARPDEVALARDLVTRPTLYSVRFKKAGETLGTRYDFFFYSEGHWRTGNQLGKILAKRDAELTAAPPPR